MSVYSIILLSLSIFIHVINIGIELEKHNMQNAFYNILFAVLYALIFYFR